MTDVTLAKAFLPLDEQRAIVDALRGLSPGFYVPITRWGQAMRVKMNCLGMHWSARDYKYHPNRVDADGLRCAPIPGLFHDIAKRGLMQTGYISPGEYRDYDICIVNWYPEETGKMGDHVDNSETPESLASGYPVLSLSIGASAVFRIGGLVRTDPYDEMTLESGDLILFGRSRRLAYHGIKKLLAGTTPPDLGLTEAGRINLTFRVY